MSTIGKSCRLVAALSQLSREMGNKEFKSVTFDRKAGSMPKASSSTHARTQSAFATRPGSAPSAGRNSRFSGAPRSKSNKKEDSVVLVGAESERIFVALFYMTPEDHADEATNQKLRQVAKATVDELELKLKEKLDSHWNSMSDTAANAETEGEVTEFLQHFRDPTASILAKHTEGLFHKPQLSTTGSATDILVTPEATSSS
eukprot:Clim_evm92s157 gene=Clim_evmTU92s157